MQTNTSSRRQLLVKTKGSNTQDPVGSRVVTVREISRMKVRVPYNLAETDSALMIAVNPDGQLVPGLVNRKDQPKMYPVDDLNRLTSCRAVVSSIESTLAKNSAIDELKDNVANLLFTFKIADKDLIVRPSTQSELMQLRPKVTNLRENEELFQRNKLDKSEYRSQIQNWFSQSFKACETFVIALCTGKDDKLASLLTQYGIPKWFFEKISSAKHTELSQVNAFTFLFPKKLSKMIAFTVSELESNEFIQNQSLFRDRLMMCDLYLSLHPETNKKALVYPVPYDFSTCFREYTDLPKYNRTDSKVTMFSVAVIHSVFAAFEPKLTTIENLVLHHSSLCIKEHQFLNDLYVIEKSYLDKSDQLLSELKDIPDLVREHLLIASTEKYGDKKGVLEKVTLNQAIESLVELNKDYFNFIEGKAKAIPQKRVEIFIDPDSNRNIKSQYLDIIREEQITAFCKTPELLRVLGLTKSEVEILPMFIPSQPSEMVKRRERKPYISPLFFKVEIPKEAFAFRKKLDIIQPVEPKSRNRGNPNSTLGKEGVRFTRLLANAKAHPVFIENVRSYLTLFHSLSFQDQAVKIMEASIKLKEVVNYFDEEEAYASTVKEEEASETDDDNPLGGLL